MSRLTKIPAGLPGGAKRSTSYVYQLSANEIFDPVQIYVKNINEYLFPALHSQDPAIFEKAIEHLRKLSAYFMSPNSTSLKDLNTDLTTSFKPQTIPPSKETSAVAKLIGTVSAIVLVSLVVAVSVFYIGTYAHQPETFLASVTAGGVVAATLGGLLRPDKIARQ